jgi:putative chitinase
MSPELLVAAVDCGILRAATYAEPLTKAMQKWGIDTPLRQAAFLGQVAHESASLSTLEESFAYKVKSLMMAWSSRFPTVASALPFAGNKDPKGLAEKVYGGRMGNGTPGDGYRYRGRGLKQLTGKENYLAYMLASGADAIVHPDLLLMPGPASDSAGWFWNKNGCSSFADKREMEGLTRRINGGKNGLADRLVRIDRAMKALGAR